MNVFILDYNPVIAAQMQCDKHICKMVLETAQMLSTVANGPYKPTHANHPCTVWARANRTNYNWLVTHGLALCAEYSERYHKVHKCQAVIEQLADKAELFPIGVSEFAQAMPDQYKHKDAVMAYRRYYHSKAEFAVWKDGNVPYWWQDPIYLI